MFEDLLKDVTDPKELNRLEQVRQRSKDLAKEHYRLKRVLVERRRELGLSQKQVAERMGTTQQTVNKFEHYDSDPRLSTIARYANAVESLILHAVIDDTHKWGSRKTTYSTTSNRSINTKTFKFSNWSEPQKHKELQTA